MKTLYDPAVQAELNQRLRKLTRESRPQWGKMNAAQMLAHCTAGMQVPVGDLKMKWSPLGLIGWMFKGMIYSEEPFKKDSPTAPEFRMADEREFDLELKRYSDTFGKLGRGPSSVVCFRSSFFGKMSAEDWGYLMYKHVNHHFTQFGI